MGKQFYAICPTCEKKWPITVSEYEKRKRQAKSGLVFCTIDCFSKFKLEDKRPITWSEGLSVKDKTREWTIKFGKTEDRLHEIIGEPNKFPFEIVHVVDACELDKANAALKAKIAKRDAEIAALTLAYNSLESVHFKEFVRLTRELAEEKQLRLSRERWVERVSEERDRYRSMASKLAESLERWISATDINRNNSDVKNYEEFALECMDAFDNCRAQLQQWRDLEKGEM